MYLNYNNLFRVKSVYTLFTRFFQCLRGFHGFRVKFLHYTRKKNIFFLQKTFLSKNSNFTLYFTLLFYTKKTLETKFKGCTGGVDHNRSFEMIFSNTPTTIELPACLYAWLSLTGHVNESGKSIKRKHSRGVSLRILY